MSGEQMEKWLADANQRIAELEQNLKTSELKLRMEQKETDRLRSMFRTIASQANSVLRHRDGA